MMVKKREERKNMVMDLVEMGGGGGERISGGEKWGEELSPHMNSWSPR